MRTGTADLPLHGGKAPHWLMQRMERLSSSLIQLLVLEYGPSKSLQKLSDPYWFQALGCLLGFDWHSSGVTTTVCGALKKASGKMSHDTGLYIFGGKGKYAINTKNELNFCETIGLNSRFYIDTSRLTAKIDNACVQDGFSLYHHSFFLAKSGEWAVIQQGLNPEISMARRYHWSSHELPSYTKEPQIGIVCEKKTETLNLVGEESQDLQKAVLTLVQEKPELLKDCISQTLRLPERHPVLFQDVDHDRLHQIFLSFYEEEIDDFKKLVQIKNVGPKTLRALALTASLVCDEPINFKDPARYSFAHGGKDGFPYPVSIETYEETISFFEKGIRQSKSSPIEKDKFFTKLKSLTHKLDPRRTQAHFQVI